MTNMKASVLIYWMFLFQSMLIASTAHTTSYRTNHEETSRKVEAITTEESVLGLFNPSSWMTVPNRSKRSGDVAEETVATRHSKHRKRRRCRNRPACFRAASSSRLFPSRNNNTEQKAKSEDYDITEAIEEKSRLDAKDRTIVTNNNTSIVDNAAESDLLDTYDERVLSDEIEFEKTEASFSAKGQTKKNEVEENVDYEEDVSPFYIEDQVEMPESLGALLSKLFQSLRNASATESHDIFKELNFVNATNEDPCQKWLNSKDKLEKVFLGGLVSLPSCPCEYPSNIFYEDKIWDEKQKKYFRWRDVSGNSQRLDIYKPGATYCIRSLLTQGSGSAAAQHCCYDRSRKLLTRGSGAGTTNFVSPEISPILHERIDILPWRLCKGDFSRYNGVRPPNNDNSCEANPDDEEYQRQIDNTKYY
ncbi:uncharacterized protein LOC114877593 [Osmia bicornis bicornis]|uniref:uncharacterized protein LOC114877593 n=1 Tax=Osmia bicornis bicornis TaxID=1437191 RepID=UPI001EAF7271|nr:uncharacterized protein LOC114877593 [Osmia bicornis bicornis]